MLYYSEFPFENYCRCHPWRRNSGMDFRQEFRMEQSQKQKLEHRIELRLEILQNILLQIRHILKSTEADPAKYWVGLITFLSKKLQANNLQQGFMELLTNPHLVAQLTVQSSDSLEMLLSPTKKTLMDIAIVAIHRMTGGEFQSPSGEVIKTNISKLNQAFTQPATLQEEIIKLENLRSAESTAGLELEIQESQTALLIAEALSPMVENMVALLTLSYSLRDENNQSYVKNFFRDLLITEKLQFLVADRIMARFAGRFIRASRTQLKTHTLGIVNTVFEYMMVCIGIVDPKLFSLQSAKNDPVDAEILGITEEELTKIYHKYNLHRDEVFFWNRWAVVGKKPTAITDNKIRELMQVFQKEDGDHVLQAVKLDNLFENIQSLLEDKSDGELTPEETQDQLRHLIGNVLTSSEVSDLIIQLLREKWYQRFLSLGFGKMRRR